jgi:GNAT superfamily N-acetyltransferase
MNENLGPQFTFKVNEGQEGSWRRIKPHMVLAYKGETPVGYLAWNPDHGEIDDLEVHPNHRRQGVATKMFREAQAWADKNGEMAPEHSSVRTHAGIEWSKAVSPGVSTKGLIIPPKIKFNKKRFLDHFEEGYSGEHESY